MNENVINNYKNMLEVIQWLDREYPNKDRYLDGKLSELYSNIRTELHELAPTEL